MRHLRFSPLIAVLATAMIVASSQPASAASWEGSTTQKIVSSTLDLLVVRPLATGRVAVGVLMMVPAVILASPSGREGIDGAYEVLLREPAEYAFSRPIGQFDD